MIVVILVLPFKKGGIANRACNVGSKLIPKRFLTSGIGIQRVGQVAGGTSEIVNNAFLFAAIYSAQIVAPISRLT